MAYDENLAHRIRELLVDESDVTETKMFGGLAFRSEETWGTCTATVTANRAADRP